MQWKCNLYRRDAVVCADVHVLDGALTGSNQVHVALELALRVVPERTERLRSPYI